MPADLPREVPVARTGYLYWVMKVVLTPVLTVALRPRVEGVEHVPSDGPVILACNHVSYLDWLVLPLVVRRRRIVFLAKREYFTRRGVRGRLQRYFFTATGQVPIDRSDSRASDAALTTAARLLSEGRILGVFPEGTRSLDNRLQRGKTGLARMAAATGAPVIPCATVGLFDVAPSGVRVPRPRRIAVRFGPPVHWARENGQSPSGADLRARTNEVMALIQALSGQECTSGETPSDPPTRTTHEP